MCAGISSCASPDTTTVVRPRTPPGTGVRDGVLAESRRRDRGDLQDVIALGEPTVVAGR
jgi:hypothetical protein